MVDNITEAGKRRCIRRFYWNHEVVAEIRHDSLFASPNILSGFVWDKYVDIEARID